MIYKCGGRNRRDEDGQPICDYEATKIWIGRCPKCKGPYTPIRFGYERIQRVEVTAAQSTDPQIQVKYVPSGIEGFDDIIGGGVVASQSILLGGPGGCRKTSLSMLVLDGLTKQTTRPMLYTSAEMNDAGVLRYCHMLGVTNGQIKIRGNAGDLETTLQYCEEVRPLAVVFDSMQAIAKSSGLSEDHITDRISKFCLRTKMIAIIVSHFTADLSFKGGTGPVHNVDTVMAFVPYSARIDGNPVKVFGREVATEIGWDEDLEDESLLNLRILIGGAGGKNRYGDANKRSFWFTPDGGAMRLLRPKPKSKIESIDEFRAALRKRKEREEER